MQHWQFAVDNLSRPSYWAGNCWDRNTDTLWKKQIYRRIMLWKGAQKSPSSEPAFIACPKQLFPNATCCYCHCYCGVIICFQAHLLPGRKSALGLLWFHFFLLCLHYPGTKSPTWVSWNNHYHVSYSSVFWSEKTDTLQPLIFTFIIAPTDIKVPSLHSWIQSYMV